RLLAKQVGWDWSGEWRIVAENQNKIPPARERSERVPSSENSQCLTWSPGTDLKFSIKGIPAVSCYGEHNIPDGEVFTAPVKDSVNGTVAYNCPTSYQGQDWSDVSLVFRDGKIMEAHCAQGDAAINRIFDTDEGARYVGEFAIGTNRGVKRPARNILFDEKIFGSFHFTPGQCYDEAPNGNAHSAVHWDLVRILRSEWGGGQISFDDVPIMIDGRFVHPDLLALNPAA
ncbi:aminopeptidase, partial [Candidatus Falkowbacteria bacterium]|nr:aminopeptidase [Candidatus Falkowbacteria bacterium]